MRGKAAALRRELVRLTSSKDPSDWINAATLDKLEHFQVDVLVHLFLTCGTPLCALWRAKVLALVLRGMPIGRGTRTDDYLFTILMTAAHSRRALSDESSMSYSYEMISMGSE